MLGTIVNALAVIAGTFIGLLLKKGLPEKISDVVMKGVALCVLYIGISSSLSGTNALIAILSIVVGAVIGSLLDIDRRLNSLGELAERKLSKDDGKTSIAEGFVSASLLFCVGSMAIVGSIQSGLTGNHEMIYTKSMLDGISAIIFASTLGVGVFLSAAAVLVYQGIIVLCAQWVQPFLSDYVVAEMTCVGGLLIIALALNMLGVTKLKTANYLPAVFIPIILCMFM
ncbi:MAG: DUF554 domain-containing protein [Oscillospiraceae bacterium]|nr:DUF554 domain-containing protein [Oscillospiraceae bacterium]